MAIKYILLALSICFFVGQAYADYIGYIGIRVEDKHPRVCIAEDHRSLYPVYSALHEWREKLGMHFQITKLKNHENKTTTDYPQCNIFIVYDENSTTRAIGKTYYDYRSSAHKHSIIVIYTSQFVQKPVIDIGNKTIIMKKTLEVFTPDTLKMITIHEFGHALGLDHKITTRDNHFRSVMEPLYTSDSRLTEHDINAVKKLYPEGFKKYHTPIPPPYPP